MSDLTLTGLPSVRTGLLIRTSPERVFEAIVEPSLTTKVWYTTSSGRMEPGAKLTWTWEMYGGSSEVTVEDVEPHRRVRFRWSGYNPDNPTTVEFRCDRRADGSTYLQVTETGFTGDADTVVANVIGSTTGFTFLLCALKALLEENLELGITRDVHPDKWVT